MSRNEPPATVSAVIFGCAGLSLGADERAFFKETQPWGYILFTRNVGGPDDIRRLVDDLREAAGWEAPILIDQEGGRVARLRGPLWRDWPPVGAWVAEAEAGRMAEAALQEALRLRYRLIAAELAPLGVDVNCAPLLDLTIKGAHEIIGDRALGGAPETIAPRARAVAEGLRQGGVLPVIKHIPGHGRALVDSHHALPTVETGLETLQASDFAAFRPLADEALGMTAHIIFEALDAARPATLSATVIERIIRAEVGFDGLLMSDDLCMKALSGPMDARVSGCLDAGCDIALHCSGVLGEMVEAQAGLRPLNAEGRRRSDAALAGRGVAEPLDESAAEARLRALTGWTGAPRDAVAAADPTESGAEAGA